MEEEKSKELREPLPNTSSLHSLNEDIEQQQIYGAGLSPDSDPLPLSKEEIDQAYGIIDNKYPLNFLSLFEVLSLNKICKPCSKQKTKKFTSNKMTEIVLKQALDKKKNPSEEDTTKLSKSNSVEDADSVEKSRDSIEQIIKHNPLNILGLGIVAQFSLMKFLIVIFTVFSVLCIPIIIMYSEYSAMSDAPGIFAEATLGNLGYSTSRCFFTSRDTSSLTLT